MQVDFFQVLRRVQKEERNKSSLARVENDFYKQLREYIKNLERSVANDPFGNEQLLLNNAQRIATEICELRESKITKAANNNIYRSFLLFKKDNPQFDLLDTTPLNLTDEEETLYFSLMDALKNHRYRISLDEYTEDSKTADDYGEESFDDDFDEDDEDTSFVEDSYEDSIQSEGSVDEDLEDEISDALGEVEDSYEDSIQSEGSVDEDLEDEISDALGESTVGENSTYTESTVSEGSVSTQASVEESPIPVSVEENPIQEETSTSLDNSSDAQLDNDDVLNRLNQIKDAKVITDEKYEPIEKQIANQKVPSQNEPTVEKEVQAEQSGQVNVQDSNKEVSTQSNDDSKAKSFVSDNINDIFKDPDSQFVDLGKLEPNYDDDYYNSIAAGSSYAQPSEDDFNMIFAKPKKPKSDEAKKPAIGAEEASSTKTKSIEDELGFSSGVDLKEEKTVSVDLNKAIQKPTEDSIPKKPIQKPTEDSAPKKPVDKTRGGVFARDEIANTTIVISEDVGEMVGIDGKVYGPFLENDVVILPNITAQILIDNNKASLVKL